MIGTGSVFPRSAPINWGFRFQLAFGLMQFVSLGRAIFIYYLGDWVNDVAASLNGISVACLCAAVYWYLQRYGNPLSGAARVWMMVVSAITVLATLRGFGAGLITKFVLLDVLAFVSLLCFVYVGSIPQAFEDLRRVWFCVLVLSIPMNLVAMSDLSEFTRELSSGVRMARETISYRTHNTLDVVLLAGAFAFTLPRWQRMVVLIGFCQVITMQIIYQKRLESTYYLVAAFACAFVWWIEAGAWRYRLRQYMREALLAGLLVGAIVLIVQNRILIPQAIALFERSTGRSKDVEFRDGAARYFFLGNERVQIVVDALGTLSPTELAFGRGMGGGAEWASFNVAVLDSSQSELVWGSYYLEDYGFFGRRAFEIGAATPILKGGFVFWLAIYSVYAVFFVRARQISHSLAGRLCIVIVLLQAPYSFFGGDFNVSSIFQMGNYAACLGMGLAVYGSREKLVGANLRLFSEQRRRIRDRTAARDR